MFLCSIVNAYLLILFLRVILSFAQMFAPNWDPPQGLQPVLQVIYAVTDPPVDLLRRFIPPLRSGAIAIDLAFLAWYVIVAFPIKRLLCSLTFLGG